MIRFTRNQYIMNTRQSIALDYINSSVSSVPQTPISLSAASTLTGRQPIILQNSTIFDSASVNTLITQQSATNASLDDSEKMKQGVLPGKVGITLQQATRPGNQLKPGSAEFIQKKLNMGMKYEAAISNSMVTGNNGVRTVKDVFTNTNAQIQTARAGLNSAVTTLKNSGIISGLESSTTLGGVALAVSTFGNSIVSNLNNAKTILTSANGVTTIKDSILSISNPTIENIKNIGANVQTISNMISSGNFATSIADNFKNGLSGISSGLLTIGSGAVGKLVGGLFGKSSNVTIQQLISQARSNAEQAFLAAKESIGTLKANEPNYLGQSGIVQHELTDAEKKMHAIGALYAESTALSQTIIRLRLEVYKNPTAENLEALRVAESMAAKNTKKFQQFAKNILPDSASSNSNNTDLAALAFGSLGSTFNSNRSFVDDLRDSAKSLQNDLTQNSELGKLNTHLQKINDPQQLTGKLLKNLDGAVSKITAGPAAIMTKIRGVLGSIGGSSGLVKKPSYATNTDANKNKIAAKTGQLINNPICPLPPSLSEKTEIDRKPNEQIALQSAELRQISRLQSQIRILELEEERLYAQSVSNPDSLDITTALISLRNKIFEIQRQIAVAEAAYAAVIRSA